MAENEEKKDVIDDEKVDETSTEESTSILEEQKDKEIEKTNEPTQVTETAKETILEEISEKEDDETEENHVNDEPDTEQEKSENNDSKDAKDEKIVPGLKNDDDDTDKDKTPSKENNDSKKKKKIIAIIIAIIAIIIIILLGLTQCNGTSDSWYDSNAKNGSYEGKTQEQIIADLNAQVKEGMMNISCAATMQGKAGDPNVTARFENIEANHWDQKIKLYLGDPNDGGELLYESGALAPGQSIDTIQLNRTFDNGSYDVTAVFTGYDRDTHQEKGKLAANVTLLITQ